MDAALVIFGLTPSVVVLTAATNGRTRQISAFELDRIPIDASRAARFLAGYVAIDTSTPPGLETWPRSGDAPPSRPSCRNEPEGEPEAPEA